MSSQAKKVEPRALVIPGNSNSFVSGEAEHPERAIMERSKLNPRALEAYEGTTAHGQMISGETKSKEIKG